MSDPYAARRRTACDYRFHTKEQRDFYETVLLDKKPIVSDMRWVDWKYIDDNEDYFRGEHESFRMNEVDKFVGQKLTKWNDEMIMQFYSTAHFYPDGRIVWMTEGIRYQSTISEWASLLGAPKEEDDDYYVYAKLKMDHHSMANMYTAIPQKDIETHKLGSVKHLLPGLATTNTILRYTLLPKSRDDKMICGHSINLLHLFDTPQKFKVMSLIVETIKRTAADQKRSCGYAPHIQMLINAKAGTGTYLLDREHLPLRPEFEDNVIVMDPSHPTSAQAQEEIRKAQEAKEAQEASAPNAPIANHKTPKDHMTYLLEATLRIERSLANLTQTQASFERIIETKFQDLDVKVTDIQTTVEQLQGDVDAIRKAPLDDSGDDRPTTERFQKVPRTPRSAAVPVVDPRTTVSAPAVTAPV